MTKRKRYFNVTISGHFQALDEGEAARFMWDAVSLKYPSANVAVVVECNRKSEQSGTAVAVNMENFKIVDGSYARWQECLARTWNELLSLKHGDALYSGKTVERTDGQKIQRGDRFTLYKIDRKNRHLELVAADGHRSWWTLSQLTRCQFGLEPTNQT